MGKVKAKLRGKVQGIKKGTSSSNADRPAKNANFRTRNTINRLNMYKNGGSAIRNREGKIIKEAQYQEKLKSGTQARVEPNRKWFGNTRVIGQESLQKFQKELGAAIKDPFKVVLKTSKLPLSLLDAKPMAGREKIHILDTESYAETFSSKRRRKRPNIQVDNLNELGEKVEEKQSNYDVEKDEDLVKESDGTQEINRNPLLNAGQSKRIWGELYRVLDSADVVIQVLDARDPQGTRCRHIERYLEKEKPHKHLIFLLNKVDLQPISVTRKWVQILQKERPTLAFHASINKPFGKGALISLLRQFAILHKDKKSISVGFIGYPNVGKSSVINTMKKKKVCNVAPIPGETKVWQFVAMTKRVFLIDCPGVVYSGQEHDETELVLRGVCRVENITEPQIHIPEVLKRAKHEHLARLYQITGWEEDESGIDFLDRLARSRGKLLKGGEPDFDGVARTVLRDWQYGKIPYLTQPDENYESKEKKPLKEKPESETDAKKRQETAEKRKEIESKLNVDQDLEAIKTKDMDEVEDYGQEVDGEEENNESEAEEEEDQEEDNSQEERKAPVSEFEIMQEKLKKAKMAMARGFLQRKQAVDRNIARREKLESQVDLTKIVREIEKEEKKEKVKEEKMARFDDTEEKQNQEVETGDEPAAKKIKVGTAKERRAAERAEKEQKGTNYYSTANVKNKNRNKSKEIKSKLNAGRNKKTQQRKHQQ